MDFYNPESDIKGILVCKEGPMYDNAIELTLIEAKIIIANKTLGNNAYNQWWGAV